MRIKRKIGEIAFSCFCLIYLSLCQLNNNVKKPQIILSSSHEQTIIVKEYQTVTLKQPSLSYTVGVQIYQRKPKPNEKLIRMQQLLKERKSQFTISDRCTYNDPELQIIQLQQIQIQSNDDNSNFIKDYHINHNSKRAFVLTNKQIQVYSVRKEIMSMVGVGRIPFYQDIQRVFFFELEEDTMITDGYSVYKIATGNSNMVDIVLWKQLIYSQKKQKDQLNFRKIISLGNNTIFVLTDKFYCLFSFKDGNITEIIPKKVQIQLSKFLTNGTFVDAIWQEKTKDTVHLLTDFDGIIQVKNFLSDYKIYHYKIGQLGRCQSFIKFGKVFEIIFVVSKGQRYVGQFYYEQNDNGKQSLLLLNRFYDKVSSIKDIEYIFNHLFILGENQFKIYGPAVNRYVYLNNGFQQAPYSGYNYEFNWVQTVQDYDNLSISVIGVSNEYLTLFQLKKVPPNITCNFQEDTDLLIKFYGSNSVALTKDLFQVDMLYRMKVKYEFTVEIALIVTTVIILVVGCFAYLSVFLGINLIDKVNKKVKGWADKLDQIRKRKENADGTFSTFGNQKNQTNPIPLAQENVNYEMQEK